MVDVDDLKRIPLSNVISKYMPLRKNGTEYYGICPFHSENTPSFTIVDRKGFYHCFGCGAHGDHFSFLMDLLSVDFKIACEIISGERTGPKTRYVKTDKKDESVYDNLTYLDAPFPKVLSDHTIRVWNPKRGRWFTASPNAVYSYDCGYVIRIDLRDLKKITPMVRWVTRPDHPEPHWALAPFSAPRQLYRRSKIRDKGQIIVVEGEKCADALAAVTGWQVVSWAGGTNGINKTDFTPLAGRKVILWPDNDNEGVKAMGIIMDMLRGMGCTVLKITPPLKKPKGWDCADAIDDDGMTKENLKDFIKEHLLSTPTGEFIPALPDGPKKISPPELDDTDYEPVIERSPAKQNRISDLDPDTSPFRFLGYDAGKYYFLPHGSQQVTVLTSGTMSRAALFTLAPLSYWENFFPSPKSSGFDHEAAQNALIQKSLNAGIFRPEKLRGVGAWIDRKRTVVHYGNEMLVDGEIMSPNQIDSEYIYERSITMPMDITVPLKTSEAYQLVSICRRVTWENPLSGLLLAGWIVIAPVCGALKWRPHVWVTGSSGSGKSTVTNDIVGRMLEGVGVRFDGKTTEAAIRQKVGASARPVIYDEAEPDGPNGNMRMQSILETARVASSGGCIEKGSISGNSISYSIRMCFYFSSVNTSLSNSADESRTSRFVLHRNESDTALTHYQELIRDINNTLTPEFRHAMISRTIKYLPTLLKNIETFWAAATVVLGNARAAQQISAMLGGLYLCHSSNEISLSEAELWLRRHGWSDHAMLNKNLDESKLLTRIIMTRCRYIASTGHAVEETLGELILKVRMTYDYESVAELRRYGIVVEQEHFIIANTNPAIDKILFKTQWADDWKRPLLSLAGASKTEKPIYFCGGLTARGVKLPLTYLYNTNTEITTKAIETLEGLE